MARAFSTDLWEKLYYTYLAIAIVVGALVLGWLFYNMWKFRAKADSRVPPDAPRPGVIPAERGHVMWIYIMAGGIAAIMFTLAFSTISAIETIEEPPEGEPALHFNVTGLQFGWRFNYSGEGGVLFPKTSPGGAFVVPVDTNVVMNVTSQDVWHNFAIPDYRIRIDAIPGETNHIWFKATEVGETHTVCVMLCGTGHAQMRATLQVLTKADYDKWLHDESVKAYAAAMRRADTTTVNVTFDGSQLVAEQTHLPAGKTSVLNITNSGAQAIDVTNVESGARTSIAPGANGYLFVPMTTKGSYTITAGAARLAFEVS